MAIGCRGEAVALLIAPGSIHRRPSIDRAGLVAAGNCCAREVRDDISDDHGCRAGKIFPCGMIFKTRYHSALRSDTKGIDAGTGYIPSYDAFLVVTV
jgi:hypothetical protein